MLHTTHSLNVALSKRQYGMAVVCVCVRMCVWMDGSSLQLASAQVDWFCLKVAATQNSSAFISWAQQTLTTLAHYEAITTNISETPL